MSISAIVGLLVSVALGFIGSAVAWAAKEDAKRIRLPGHHSRRRAF